MRRFFAFAVLAALCLSAPAKAETFPAHSDLFVNDHAGVLDPAAEDGLRATLGALATETGIEMTVLTIRSRDDYDPSASIEAFATGLFNDWGIGRADRNDGILVLVATADREMRIELGSAYGQGYDVLAQDIISRFFLPDFRAGDHQRGNRRDGRPDRPAALSTIAGRGFAERGGRCAQLAARPRRRPSRRAHRGAAPDRRCELCIAPLPILRPHRHETQARNHPAPDGRRRRTWRRTDTLPALRLSRRPDLRDPATVRVAQGRVVRRGTVIRRRGHGTLVGRGGRTAPAPCLRTGSRR